jgi:hypothetical protein
MGMRSFTVLLFSFEACKTVMTGICIDLYLMSTCKQGNIRMSPKKDEPTATVSVRLGENMKRILEAIAYEERRTVSSLLGRLIDNHVKSYDPKTIARALHAVQLRERDAGEVPVDAIMKEVERLQRPAPPSSYTAEKPLHPSLLTAKGLYDPPVKKHSAQAANTPVDKIIAEALKRLKDGTFTEEEAHRFILVGEAQERLKDGTFTEEEARQFVENGERRWADRSAADAMRTIQEHVSGIAQDLYGPRQDPVNPANLYTGKPPSVIKRKQKHHHDK